MREEVPVGRYEPVLMQVGEYEPEFPVGSELERVRWLAGLAELGFKCRIVVVVNPESRAPGFAFCFRSDRAVSDRRPDGFLVEMWLGTDCGGSGLPLGLSVRQDAGQAGRAVPVAERMSPAYNGYLICVRTSWHGTTAGNWTSSSRKRARRSHVPAGPYAR